MLSWLAGPVTPRYQDQERHTGVAIVANDTEWCFSKKEGVRECSMPTRKRATTMTCQLGFGFLCSREYELRSGQSLTSTE